jgi:hypothetical protein
MKLMDNRFDRNAHGSLYDRGHSDSWYQRGAHPHYYPDGSYNGERITDLLPDEISEYMAGYHDNEEFGDHKKWD